ncbi:helix-turn-helix domain-containing protein [Halococcus dombrowskii]|uniref:Helix-turn-helix domain-containing protein n=1 Tax=Halococcus dombrowskii TaxID=179637 RepID=A0AAV3SIH8_HALDO|nr:helix-turn-helix domain-containing protein [Halococcus dombrowskii]UOO96332.1 helix-turn-helix domain-containing protein [Halococcus dombrowskii]
MDKLADVDTEALQAALGDASESKAVKRLMVALAYADGVSVETVSARYDIPRATIYSWLDRFEQQSIAEAITDDSRPGRPAKLDPSQRRQLAADLARSPAELGYDSAEWTPERAREHIERMYDISYSLGHVRRLLQESSAGT